MIKNSWLLIIVLLMVESAVLYISTRPKLKKYFSILPAVFWIYFLPMAASLTGVIDSGAPVLGRITSLMLPFALIILLLSSDIPAVMKIGRSSLIMMLSGAAGIMTGTVAVFFVFKQWVGPDMWAGFGALSASWVGGSANMIAVKEALSVPDNVFMPMVVVDTIVPYVWMGCLISLSRAEQRYDRWNRSDMSMIEAVKNALPQEQGSNGSRKRALAYVLLITAAFGLAALWLSKYLPSFGGVMKPSAWAVITASSFGIILSMTRARKFCSKLSTGCGYFILYYVLTAIGAKADFANMSSIALLLAAGVLIVMVHAVFLLFTSRIIKAPLAIVAAASQANIGGVASAPIIAEIYIPGLGSLGLIMAVVGNVIGTYTGIAVGTVLDMIKGI